MSDFSIPLAGMSSAMATVNTAASRIARMPAAGQSQAGDTVDLSAEILALMTAKNQYQANVKAAQTLDQMSQSTIDIFG